VRRPPAAGERRAASLDRGRGDHRGREPGLHVGGAAAVDLAVDQLGRERRMRPRGRIALGDDIGVSLEEQRRPHAGGAEDAEDVRAIGRDTLNLDVEALGAHPSFDMCGDGRLGGARLARPHHARDAHEVTREGHQLVRVDQGQCARQCRHSG